MGSWIHFVSPLACLFVTAGFVLGDSFGSLREELQQLVPGGWVCSEIQNIEGDTQFEVHRKESGFSIYVVRHALISQKEWDLRKERMARALDMVLSGNGIEGFDPIFAGMELPTGRYGDTAVRVQLSQPDIVYPGFDDDYEEALKAVKAILSALELYKRSEQAAAGDPVNAPNLK